MMKKLGFLSMMSAALLLVSCNNLGNDPDINGNGGGNDEPQFVEPAGDGTEANPYNVSRALLVQDGSLAWVKGYIVGQVAGSDITAESEFDAPFHGATYDDGSVATTGTNILIAAKADEKNHSACLVVQLPKGDVRTVLELVKNPTNDGKPVELYGKLTKYFGVAGLKETSAAKFDGTTIGQVPEGPTTPPAGAEGDGSENNPYNITAATANQNGALAWVKGFIVGHVAGSSISSESQFDAPFTGAVYDDGTVATQGTNILIAASATENNPSACFVVQLPKGDVRTALDLLAHPEIDGKEVVLYGKLTKYFGVAGMKETSAAKLDGKTIGQGGGTTDPDTPVNPGVGEGNGTKESPYNVAAVIGLNNSGAKAWVKAYIVGQINGKSISNIEAEAPFGVPDGSTQGTNIVIADNADDTNNVVPVQLPSGAVRNALSLPDHPEMDGKEVLLYGELVKYFGACGIKNTSCAIVDGVVYGVEPADVVTPEGNVIFEESFATSLGVFIADNRSLDPALTYVWNYDDRYKCAKASAFNKQAYEAESWLVSPAIAMNGKEAILTFDHAANYIKNATDEMRLFYTTDNGENWTELTIPTYATSWTFVNAGNITIPAAESVKIAFAYKSTAANACTWEIQNVKIYQ